MKLFDTYIDPGLKFIRKHAIQGMGAVSRNFLDYDYFFIVHNCSI